MNTSWDVIVFGGGTAGIVAGIQSARAGARTLVVEKNGMLGGTMTVGGIPCPGSFCAYGVQVVAGIPWELCLRALDEEGKTPPDPASVGDHRGGGRYGLGVNPAIFAAIADEALVDAGAELLFHAMPASVHLEDNRWRVSLCTKTGLAEMTAGVIVDCTGDANVVAMAGFEVRRSRELQPATLVVTAKGYDPATLDYEALQAAFDAEVAAGRMKTTDSGWNGGRIDFFLKSHGGNRIHVCDVDGDTSEARTHAELEGRRAMMRLLRFCRRQPGLENFTIASMAPECGIRETVTIKGKTEITIDDYMSGRMYDDAVCHSFYAVDIHRPDHIDFRNIEAGVYPTIPLGSLIPEGSRRMIVAGRCASGDQEANSSYRTESTCMAMGQAAGAAAALAATGPGEIEAAPLEELRGLLRKHGAIVPGDPLGE